MADILGAERSTLVITFKDDFEDTFNFTISNPKYDVTEAEIKEIAEHIIANNLFTKGSAELVSFVKARVTVTDTDKYDLSF